MKIVQQSVQVISPSTEEEALAGLKRIEYAGRNCYASHDKITDGSWKKFIAALIRRGHDAPVEFASMTLDLTT